MRRYLSVAAAVVALFVLMVGGAAIAKKKQKPIHVRVGNLELTFDGGLTPEAISKTKLTPVSLNVSGKIRTVDGEHPPAMKEFDLEGDRNTAVDVEGVPVCAPSALQSRDTKQAEAACRPAIIGSGQATAGIKFPEQPEILAPSKIIAFNGGTKGGVTTFYIHAFLTVPTPAAVVSTVKIKRVHKGRYGLASVTSIPKIAGGSGSVRDFNLTINKKGVLLAKCVDGKIQARGTAVFTGGPRVAAEVIRTCIGKG